MKLSKFLLSSGALLIFSGAPLFAQSPSPTAPVAIAPPEHPATTAQIREFYELSGMQKLLQQLTTQMVSAMRLTSKDTVPASVWDQMQTDFAKYDWQLAIAPAYQRYISQEDMAVALAYMKSDVARRMKANEPYIQSAISEVSQKAGREIGEKAARDHMDEILALQKKNDAAAAARANGTTSKPQIVLPPEVNSQ
jgi:hypothetical protein